MSKPGQGPPLNGQRPVHYHSLSQPQRQGNYSPTHSLGGVSQHSGSRVSYSHIPQASAPSSGNGHQQLVYENLDYYGDNNG